MIRKPVSIRGAAGRSRVSVTTLPAPVGGINGRDPLAAMPETDAVDVENWYPREDGLVTRDGHVLAVDLGTNAPVRFLEAMDDGDPRVIAASGGKIFQVVGTAATQLATGLTSDRWRSAILNDRMFLVNGADAPRTIMGASATATGWTGTGLTIANLFRVRAYRKRLFFAEKGEAAFWYAGANNITGALTRFDLSGIGNRGGTIVEIATMTPDGGEGGNDDAIAFFMSSGEIIVYSGSDPNDAANWGVVGVFRAARPIAVYEHAGDVLCVTTDGYAPLSRLLPSGRSAVEGFGDKLGTVAAKAIRDFGKNEGWRVLYDPPRQMLLVGIPQAATRFEQHVCNLRTGAWARWTGLPAVTWGHSGDDLLFGTPTGTIRRLTGSEDDGVPVVGTGQGAWSALGAPGRRKRVTMVRPVVIAVGATPVAHRIGADFRSPVTDEASDVGADESAAVWGAAVWNAATWAGAEEVQRDWRGGGAEGEFVSVGLRAEARAGPVKWVATGMAVEVGGVL